MDNITHTLTGLALARAGLKRFTPHGTLLVIIAANIPDIDMVSLVKGWPTTFEIHRGYTHSLIGLPFMALLAVAITSLLTRKRLPWRAASLVALVGVISHFLLDWSMSYGVRFLIPFSSRWSYLDLFALYDWVILAVLALAWAAPALSKLVSDEIGAHRTSGRGAAIFALCFIAIYGGFRGAMHARVISQLNARIYEDALGSPATRMAAVPQSLNPLSWDAIVEGEHAYRLYTLSALGQFDPGSGRLLYKTNWDGEIDRISRSRFFQFALYFARFPYWQKEPAGPDLTTVSVTDLRFGPPGVSFFKVNAIVDRAGNIQRMWLGDGGGKPIE